MGAAASAAGVATGVPPAAGAAGGTPSAGVEAGVVAGVVAGATRPAGVVAVPPVAARWLFSVCTSWVCSSIKLLHAQ